MKFESRKDILFSTVILGINVFLIALTMVGIINGELKEEEYWAIAPISIIVGFLFWLYFGTNYKLSEDGLNTGADRSGEQ